ncbi:MAG: DUF86 domain-containing protein [Blautia sp.]|nr:DUF86 domain-containing protein [Blautia sp.]
MRGKKSERIILQKMMQYCDEIEQILKKHHSNRAEFEDDKEFQFACGMCIIQIGELVAGLDESFVEKYPDIPWRQIKGMRNIYAHDYDIIDNDIIWETITKEIPELKEKLQIIFSAL